MAEVYRAERVDGSYAQTVALKVLRPSLRSAEFTRRFVAERHILARLSHPDIVPILDGGVTPDGRPYLVMPLVVGEPITAYAIRQAMTLESRLRLFARVAAAVQFAHARLVVHRDLKPSNILVDSDGGVHLLDFGIAKLLDTEGLDEASQQTRTNVRLLTPEHAAPEQLTNGEVTTATDVYSLGVLLFELLTGRRPYVRGDRSPAAMEQEILEERAPAPSTVVHDRALARTMRGDVDRMIHMALRRDPERRYPSAGQFREDVLRYLEGRPIVAQPDSTWYRTKKLLARNRLVVISAATVMTLLIASSIVATVQARRLARERDASERERATAEAVIGLLTDVFNRANPLVVPGGDTLRVAALLDAGEQKVDSLSDSPAVQARMWHVLGNMRAARGEYARAKGLLERAWKEQKRLAGTDDDVEVARTYHDYARSVLLMDGPEAARPMFRASRARLPRLAGASRADSTSTLQELASVTPDVDEQNALLDTLLHVTDARTSDDSISMAGTFNVMGATVLPRRPAEAVTDFQASLRIVSRVLPVEHPIRTTVVQNLMTAYMASGDYIRADSLAAIVAEIERRSERNGAKAPGMTIANRGLLRARLGDYDGAERLLHESVSRYRSMQGPGHVGERSTLRDLALILGAHGKLREGVALFDSLIATDPAPDKPERKAHVTLQRARLLLREGRIDEAARDLAEVERVYRARLPATSGDFGQLRFWQGITAIAQGNPGAAVAGFDSTYTRLLESLPARHPAVLEEQCARWVAMVRDGQRTTVAADSAGRDACAGYARDGLAYPLLVAWGREAAARGAK